MPHSLPITLPWDETFNVGLDTGTPVDDQDYQVPFRFTGKIVKLTVKLDRLQMRAAVDAPAGGDPTLLQRIETRLDKREECRRQADAKKLGVVAHVEFVRECMR
jgi:arylsulfatase